MEKYNRYKKLVGICRVVYPDLKKQIQYKNAQTEWNHVKESPENYEKLMVSLKAKAVKHKSDKLQWWNKAVSKGTRL